MAQDPGVWVELRPVSRGGGAVELAEGLSCSSAGGTLPSSPAPENPESMHEEGCGGGEPLFFHYCPWVFVL